MAVAAPLPLVTGVPAHAVGDTIDAVFRSRPFVQAMHPSLLAGVMAWIVHAIGAVVQSALKTPGAIPVITWTLYIITALVVGRLLYVAIRYYLATRRGGTGGGSAEAGKNLWDEADRLANDGNYTAAAHTVYAAFVRAFVSRGVVRAHSSKTIGDYVRELRSVSARAANAVAIDAFTGFAREYEVVVYRDGMCDAARYAALRALAAPVAEPRAAPRMAA